MGQYNKRIKGDTKEKNARNGRTKSNIGTLIEKGAIFMKKILTTLLLAALFVTPSAFAATQDEALSTAQRLAGEGAVLRESELDNGVYEFEFADEAANARIDVDIMADSGAPLKMDVNFRSVKKAKTAALDEAQAREAAQTLLGEAAVIDYALPEQDDGRYEWKLFYTDGGNSGVLTLQAETGEVQDRELYFDANALTAQQAVQALESAKGAVQILELDLDLDDAQTLNYDGRARLDGAVYEFELRASDGQIVEWERD